ncbi:MAG: hypothetical protein M1823_000569 [Watsoniomyces obsoletus]|nr:MAG: hypothetical protein M1823_000569 [Watsoniomyces obsoletus]
MSCLRTSGPPLSNLVCVELPHLLKTFTGDSRAIHQKAGASSGFAIHQPRGRPHSALDSPHPAWTIFRSAMMHARSPPDYFSLPDSKIWPTRSCCALRIHRTHRGLRVAKVAKTTTVRHRHATAVAPLESAVTPHAPMLREAYLNLVDHYDDPGINFRYDSNAASSENTSSIPPSEDPSVDAGEGSSLQPLWTPLDSEEQRAVRRLHELLDYPEASSEVVYEAYQQIPPPRIPWLSGATIERLLRRLSVVERRNVPTMMRFLSVMDDVQAAGIRLKADQWNSAISFAGRCFSRVSTAEVEAALHIFRAMEATPDVQATGVTFTVLFDVAAKAGKYSLAELILQEMRRRGLPLDRFGHVGQIFYGGVRRDGQAVRAAYRRLVHEGQMVDTLVLNCVIASLLRADETTAAQLVYARMKQFHADGGGRPLPPNDWQTRRGLGRGLRRLARMVAGDPDRWRKEQDQIPMAPDLRTYQHLIRHHCTKTGRLEEVTTLIDEMPWYRVPLHGTIFEALFRGFATYAEDEPGQWTASRLRSVWGAYLDALTAEVGGLDIRLSLVRWSLRAHRNCIGPEAMLDIWEKDIQPRWDVRAGDRRSVEQAIGVLFRQKGRPWEDGSLRRRRRRRDGGTTRTTGGYDWNMSR